jgi:biopolymer transport protein ExbD
MAFGGFERGAQNAPMAEINMIPLIDVMLVLLVIFIITAPLLTHAVKVDLPKAVSTPNTTKPQNVQLAIDRAGLVYWNGEVVDEAGWRARMRASAALSPQPEVHVRGDNTVAYGKVVRVLSDAARLGLTRIGFITDPTAPPA